MKLANECLITLEKLHLQVVGQVFFTLQKRILPRGATNWAILLALGVAMYNAKWSQEHLKPYKQL